MVLWGNSEVREDETKSTDYAGFARHPRRITGFALRRHLPALDAAEPHQDCATAVSIGIHTTAVPTALGPVCAESDRGHPHVVDRLPGEERGWRDRGPAMVEHDRAVPGAEGALPLDP